MRLQQCCTYLLHSQPWLPLPVMCLQIFRDACLAWLQKHIYARFFHFHFELLVHVAEQRLPSCY